MTRPRTTNRLARSLGAATLITAALSASACNGSPDATQTPSTTVPSSTPTPTPSTPAPPVLPAKAKGLTVESADAFTRFYLELLDYAKATGGTSAVRAWSDKGCIGCGQAIRDYDKVHKAGGAYSGDYTYTGYHASVVRLNKTKTGAEVKFTAQVGRHSVTETRGGAPRSYPGGPVRYRMTLVGRNGQWIAYELEDVNG